VTSRIITSSSALQENIGDPRRAPTRRKLFEIREFDFEPRLHASGSDDSTGLFFSMMGSLTV
jgi:hypothetical protein